MSNGNGKSEMSERMHRFVMDTAKSFEEESRSFSSDPFWRQLRSTGTEPWLDTGDIDAALELWTAEFTSLTTNNTLLNREVQKGIYDPAIEAAGKLLGGLDLDEKVIEIAFALNAVHGLRLVKTFGANVSVELHTALAHDVARSRSYAHRFHRIEPERFIVKVPLTAAGLIATRSLREEGIRVNFTLGFSARQNHLATTFAFPSYVNVFLGRCNSYVENNDLGDGEMIGEKATLASQRVARAVSASSGRRTLQIAASMRSGSQVATLAGVDVMTMPTSVAGEAGKSLEGPLRSRVDTDYEVSLDEAGSRARVEVLWKVDPGVRKLAQELAHKPPATAEELVDRAHVAGLGEMFPRLGRADLEEIHRQGKVPRHAHWAQRVASGELAVDTLLNQGGLASFAADQKELDERIRGLIG
jgi:transaldolase